MGLNKGDLVEVVWRDAVSHGLKEAYEIDDNYTPGYINKDVGYFLAFHKKFIIIGMEQGEDEDHYRGLTQIPLGDVVEIITLKRVKTVWKEPKNGNKKLSNRGQRRKAGVRQRNGKGHAGGKRTVRSAVPRDAKKKSAPHGERVPEVR